MGHRRVTVVATAVLAVAVVTPVASAATSRTAPSNGALSASAAAALEQGVPQRSIVILRDQRQSQLGHAGSATAARSAAVLADQQPIRTQLAQVHATRVHGYSTLNAIAATVTPAEIAHLQANTAVQAVVPDEVVAGATPPSLHDTATPARKSNAHAAPTVSTTGSGQICPTDPSKPLVEPEALQLMNVADQVGSTAPVAQNIVDGTGVKVGFLADGVDINDPDFIRSDGTHVFSDYQDFSGDGPNAVTSGADGFGEASSIASQGLQTYDVSNFVSPDDPLPAGCNIRVLGAAPGASLVGLQVFDGSNTALTSNILDAVDYAVGLDHVDVLDESIGSDPYPNPATDPISLVDQAAIAAGVTVVAATGDGGLHNNIQAPAVANNVMSVGATTQYQTYVQTGAEGARFGSGGWLDNNISAFSSSGQAMPGHTVSVVAPGEAGWADCSNNPMYESCTNYQGEGSNIELFGGTGESAALASGVAALVIEAYENTHHGTRPTPDVVRHLISSTATDLDAPANEQGSGLVNALKAVQGAESLHDVNGTPTRVGHSLFVDNAELRRTGTAGPSTSFTINVTNNGASKQTVTPTLQTVKTAPLSTDSGAVTLTGSDPTFPDQVGGPQLYVEHTFTVPAGAKQLDGRITWDAADNAGALVQMTLFDPSGHLVAYSHPNGSGGYGEVQVHDPARGTWTALIWTGQNRSQFLGQVVYSFTNQTFTPVGTVTPAKRTLAAGASGAFNITLRFPAHGGDFAGDLHLGTGGPNDGGLPITLRGNVPVASGSGSFSGVLDGGDGNQALLGGDNETFQFNLPANRPELNVAVNLADAGYMVTGFLIDPNQQALDIQSTVDRTGAVGKSMQFVLHNPQAGAWKLVLAMHDSNPGQKIEEPFTGTINLFPPNISARGLPDSVISILADGQPITVPVTITNSGPVDKLFFVDPRLTRSTTMPLAGTNTTVDLPSFGAMPQFIVPTDTSTLNVAATASLPINLELQAINGSPDSVAAAGSTSPTLSYSAPEATPGLWMVTPSEVGPFPSEAPAGTASVAASVQGNAFDSAITSEAGDVWQSAVNPSNSSAPVDVAAGQTVTINVTITPNAGAGIVVQGFLDIDTFNPTTNSGDQEARLPYEYTIGE
ncbi:MAG TPA: hypothetical protein VGO03_02885 [Acidimicrobiia bacterium]